MKTQKQSQNKLELKMKSLISKFNPAIAAFLMLFILIGCSNDNIVNPDEENLSDKEALLKIVDEDEVLGSFELNYNEEDVLGFLGKVNTEIFPVRVGQRMRIVNRNMDITIVGDSAFGKLTKTFEGILFIAASYDSLVPGNPNVDTLIQKPFSTTVTRNIVFKKIDNTSFPKRNWRITAISLPEGGTLTENIKIKELTVFLPNGDTISVTSPNDYYLSKDPGFKRLIPIFSRNQDVLVRVKVQSLYEVEDFVTLTYGAHKGDLVRAKRKFELIDSQFDGQYYQKTYEQTWRTRQFPGYKHAIVNALPKQVLFDDASAVEENSWGIPYYVKP